MSFPTFGANALRGPVRVFPPPVREFNFLTLNDLEALPKPEWLVKDILRAETQAVLYGPSGGGKSFVALDMALSITANRDWWGRKVKTGPVFYVVSEGGRGVLKRVKAWKEYHKVRDIGQAFFLLDAVQMLDSNDVKAFITSLIKIQDQQQLDNPALVVLDTFARSFVGGEENSAKDVGIWVEAAREIQKLTKATVLAVHHTGKNGAGERGSSALRAAAETMIEVTGDENLFAPVKMTCKKHKDDDCFKQIVFKKQPMLLGIDGDEDITSLVLIPQRASEKDSGEQDVIKDHLKPALDALKAFPAQTARSGEWRKAIKWGPKVVADSTFNKWRDDLVKAGLVEKVSKGVYRLPPPTGVPPDSHEDPPNPPSSTPTPL